MSIYSQIDSNRRRTWLVVLLFIGLVLLVGYVIGLYYGDPTNFLILAALLASGSSFFSYYFSDRLVLAVSGAKRISQSNNQRLFRIVENLCIGAGLPLPKIYLIEDSAPNAFATGRDPQHASIAITTGLLEKLDKLELEGVIAHELSHIKNFDIRLMMIVVIMVGTVALLSDWVLRSLWWGGDRRRDRSSRGGNSIFLVIGLIALIFAPLIAQLLKLALSRQREFLADASAALLTRYPNGLASALEKIARDREPLETANAATAHLYIVNPLKNYNDRVARLFSTHPPVKERIDKLRQM